MTINQGEQSPCKGCEKHNRFPSCMDSCKKLSDWQNERIASNDHSRNYAHVDTFDNHDIYN